MKWLKLYLFIAFVSFYCCNVVAPPPNRQQAQQADNNNNAQPTPEQNQPAYQFPYSKYLEIIVKILEEQPKFQKAVQSINKDKIEDVADHIDDLGAEVFDKLTKAKLEEVNRLRDEFEQALKTGGDVSHFKLPEHLDIDNIDKFGKEDLRKLIKKAVADMAEIDAKRKEEFKEYEMKKKAEEDHRLAQATEEERKKLLQEKEEAEKRHQDHEKLKHPGGKQQLEEVWEEQDQMDKDSYDPKTFFALHDLNGDGFWNNEEIEALFQIELNKLYNETDPNNDVKEKVEEMYRMREHVVQQVDKNKDGLISRDEFLNDSEAQNSDEVKDESWDDLGNQKIYTDEELKKFEEDYAKKQGWDEHAYDPNDQGHLLNEQKTREGVQRPAHQSLDNLQAQNVEPQNDVHDSIPVKNVKPIDAIYGV